MSVGLFMVCGGVAFFVACAVLVCGNLIGWKQTRDALKFWK